MGANCCSPDDLKKTSDGNQPELQNPNERKSKQLMQSTGAAAQDLSNRTESASTDFSYRAQSYAGQDQMLGDGGSSHSRPGSISNKMNLEIDIPDDKRADKNPDFKTPSVNPPDLDVQG